MIDVHINKSILGRYKTNIKGKRLPNYLQENYLFSIDETTSLKDLMKNDKIIFNNEKEVIEEALRNDFLWAKRIYYIECISLTICTAPTIIGVAASLSYLKKCKVRQNLHTAELLYNKFKEDSLDYEIK